MTTTFDALVNEVRSTVRGYNLVREQVTFLNGAINSSALSITVDDGILVQPGVIEIGSESIYIQSVAANVLTVSPDGRGWDGTTAATHADNSRVTATPPYPTWRIQRAVNDTIVGTSPTLFGVGTTSFTFSPAQDTYSLPADCDEILSVTAPGYGPSLEPIEIRNYKFNSSAPVGDFATGNCITLGTYPDPGRTVTVTYQKVPSELVSGDALTASGLRETARRCLVYGATAQLLSYVDASRATTDSAVNAGYSDVQRVGTATQLAAQLTARYQLELAGEQRRLRQTHRTKVRRTGR